MVAGLGLGSGYRARIRAVVAGLELWQWLQG